MLTITAYNIRYVEMQIELLVDPKPCFSLDISCQAFDYDCAYLLVNTINTLKQSAIL